MAIRNCLSEEREIVLYCIKRRMYNKCSILLVRVYTVYVIKLKFHCVITDTGRSFKNYVNVCIKSYLLRKHMKKIQALQTAKYIQN